MFGFRNKNKKVTKKATLAPKETEETKKEEVETVETEDKSEICNYRISKKTQEILKTHGIVKLFPIQYKTFTDIYNGLDIIGRDRTGSGKTLGYALPVIERYRAEGYFEKKSRGRKPIDIIIVPTRELVI